MIPLNRSAADASAFGETLLTSHSIHVTVQVLDLDHNYLADISPRLLDGQVDFDADAEVSRTCSLSFLDPNRTLAFDSASPHESALFLDRMIRVVYSVKVTSLGWVDCPVFCGPVDKMDRNGNVVSVTAQGKEILGMGEAFHTYVLKKGMYRTDAILQIMTDLAGETKFDIPASTARLPRDMSIGRQSQPWIVARDIAIGMNQQLFYDGRGVLRMRPEPEVPSWRFATGDGGSILTPLQLGFDSSKLINAVHTQGGIPLGRYKAVDFWSIAIDSHPLSPVSLGRGGRARYLLDTIDQPSIRTDEEAANVTKTALNTALQQVVTVKFDSLPVPHLEPADRARVDTDEYSGIARLGQFSLPLGGGPMAIGYQSRVSFPLGRPLTMATSSFNPNDTRTLLRRRD